MPGEREFSVRVLLLDGPLNGASTALLPREDEIIEQGTEFEVAAWQATGETEVYVVTRVFEVFCEECEAHHRRAIAKHRPRVTV